MFEKIDRKSSEIISALSEASVFEKKGFVNARPTVGGELVATKISGVEETNHITKSGEWIVTNPDGEQYVVDENTFLERYKPTGTDGVYEDHGYCRAIKNPFGKPIEILASWGSIQRGDEDCMVADTCDVDGRNMRGEPYLIDGKIFAETYFKV